MSSIYNLYKNKLQNDDLDDEFNNIYKPIIVNKIYEVTIWNGQITSYYDMKYGSNIRKLLEEYNNKYEYNNKLKSNSILKHDNILKYDKLILSNIIYSGIMFILFAGLYHYI